MQKKSRISFGPGAASIILIVVILSMSVLGLLALVNARNNRHFSDRSADVVEAVYTLDAEAERMFAKLDALVAGWDMKNSSDGAEPAEEYAASLPEGVSMEGNELIWKQSDELRDLECAAAIVEDNDTYALTWTRHLLTMRTEETWNLVNF